MIWKLVVLAGAWLIFAGLCALGLSKFLAMVNETEPKPPLVPKSLAPTPVILDDEEIL